MTYRGMWQAERMTDQAKVEAVAAKVKGKAGRIASYEVKDTKEYPFKLYDLTLLQREANGKYAFSAKKRWIQHRRCTRSIKLFLIQEQTQIT